MNRVDHAFTLDDLLADAALELTDDGMVALGASVNLARERLKSLVDVVAHVAAGHEARDFARRVLDEIYREPHIEPAAAGGALRA